MTQHKISLEEAQQVIDLDQQDRLRRFNTELQVLLRKYGIRLDCQIRAMVGPAGEEPKPLEEPNEDECLGA